MNVRYEAFLQLIYFYLAKKQERKQAKEDKRYEAIMRKQETQALADQEMKDIEDHIKSKSKKHR